MNVSEVKFVFLDRDGVINRKAVEGEYVFRWEDFCLLPGVEEAIRFLNEAGKTVLVVTNQRGAALGRYTTKDIETVHAQLQQHLGEHHARIDAFYYCPHDKNQCDCRKPKIGLIEQAFRDFPEANATNSILIGDSYSDIQAAKTAGMPGIFVQGDPTRQKPGVEKALQIADAVCDSLFEAVRLLLG